MSFMISAHLTRSSRKEKVSDWIGQKKRYIPDNSKVDVDWKDVHSNIKQMDQTYDAAFYAWLKSEENVLVTSIYLQRIANEYSLERISNAMEWLVKDWRWENTSILVKHVTADWCNDKGDIKRAHLLRKLTESWDTHTTAALMTSILTSSPYSTCSSNKREKFLREFTKNWDFSKLSEFFMSLRSKANIDYKFKCLMLQQAAQKDKASSSIRFYHHHKRMSSHDDLLAVDQVQHNKDTFRNRTTSSSSSSTMDHSSILENSTESSASNLHSYHHHLSNQATKKQ